MNYTRYFLLLGILGFSIWIFGVWYFETRRIYGPLFRRLPVERRTLLIVALLGLPCIYCLSYSHWRSSLGALDDLYVPVQWVLDHTILREPLLQWASIWDASPDRLVAESDSRIRNHFWGTMPPWQYATAWIFIGVICCVLPPYLVFRFRVWFRTKRNQRLLEAHPAT